MGEHKLHHVKLMLSFAPVFSAALSLSRSPSCLVALLLFFLLLFLFCLRQPQPQSYHRLLARKRVLFPITGVALSCPYILSLWPFCSAICFVCVGFCFLLLFFFLPPCYHSCCSLFPDLLEIREK